MESVIWNSVQEMMEAFVQGTVIIAIAVLGNQARQWLRARLTAERHQVVSDLAATVVTGIEQEYANADGSAKLARATNRLETQLRAAGIQLSLDEVRQALEAAVFEELNWWKRGPLPAKLDTR